MDRCKSSLRSSNISLALLILCKYFFSNRLSSSFALSTLSESLKLPSCSSAKDARNALVRDMNSRNLLLATSCHEGASSGTTSLVTVFETLILFTFDVSTSLLVTFSLSRSLLVTSEEPFSFLTSFDASFSLFSFTACLGSWLSSLIACFITRLSFTLSLFSFIVVQFSLIVMFITLFSLIVVRPLGGTSSTTGRPIRTSDSSSV